MSKTYRFDPFDMDFKPERHSVRLGHMPRPPGYGKRKVKYRDVMLNRAAQRRQKILEQELLYKDDD